MSASSPNPPETVGPYRIERRLGDGGMAEAFEATRELPAGLTQRVCIKRILPALSDDEDVRGLFLREARLVAALGHRGIARVLDFGVDGGAPYLALELVDGPDLRALLRRQPGRQLPPEVVVLLAIELAEALEHAHERGILHRDLSPANVLVSVDGEVKLTDFGVGKALETGLAQSNVVRGNLGYMAPERADAAVLASPRADLFSLGAVLFECLVGARPYRIPVAEAQDTDTNEARPALRGVIAPAPLICLVERLIRLDATARPSSAREVVDALAPIAHEALARRSLRALVRTVDAEAPIALARPVDADVRIPPRWQRYALAPKIWAGAEQAEAMRALRVSQPCDAPLEAAVAALEELTRRDAARDHVLARLDYAAPDYSASDYAALPAEWRVPAWLAALIVTLTLALGITLWWLAGR